MLEKYIIKDGKNYDMVILQAPVLPELLKLPLKCSFSRTVDNIEIDTPKGWKLNLKVEEPSFDSDKAVCCIVKDGETIRISPTD